MGIFLWVVVAVNYIAIFVCLTLQLRVYEMTEFALQEQLADKTDNYSKQRRKLQKLLPEVILLRLVVLSLLTTIQTGLLVYQTNLGLGIGLSLTTALVLTLLSRAVFLQRLVSTLFEKYLRYVLITTQKCHAFLRVLGTPARHSYQPPVSAGEFVEQLRRLPSTVLSPGQRQRLESVLASEQAVVKDIMTLKKRLVTVSHSAVLGPILLSDLQKSGHGYFPVISKDGQPEGILTLSDISDIHDAKKRITVADSMDKQIAWAETDTSVYELIQAFLQEKTYIIFVRDTAGEFVGIVTIADIMKSVLGVVKG